MATDFGKAGLADNTVAVELAKNPKRNRAMARALQKGVDFFINSRGFVPQGKSGATTMGSPSRANQNVFLFHKEQERLRNEFVDSELERRFGPQNITGSTSIVNAAGERVPVSGQGIIKATQAQRDEVSSSFLTPLQLLNAGKSQDAFTRGLANPLVVGSKERTIIGGAGIQRRRARGKSARTILTSDADELIGGKTLLG